MADSFRNDPAQIQRRHVLLGELERLLVRHPALLQGRVEVRDRLPELRGCVLSVDRIREAVQEPGHLLRTNGEDLLHILRLHLASLFPAFRHSFTWWFLVPEQAGPCIWGNRALVTTSRRCPRRRDRFVPSIRARTRGPPAPPALGCVPAQSDVRPCRASP